MKTLLTFLLRLLLLPLAPIRWLFRLLERADHVPATPPGQWQNCVKNQFGRPIRIVFPASVEELRERLNEARAVAQSAGRPFRARAVGAGHSFSEVTLCDELLVDPHPMRSFAVHDGKGLRAGVTLRDGVERHFVRIGAGIRIRDLNKALHEAGLALINMGAYDIQTISGAISTGTHGSGVSLGPLCESVRSVELLTSTDHILLEPTDGITDQPAYVPNDSKGPRLVQDDAQFYSAVVAMGCMGIVCGYTLEVRKAYRLKETREVKTWQEVRADLLERKFEDPRHYEVYVNPYVVKNGQHSCLITRREEYDGPPTKAVGARTRNPIATFVTSIRFFDRIFVYLFRRVPWLAPYLIQASIEGLADKEYIDESFKVLNLGDANLVPAYASEFALDASKLPAGAPVDSVPAFVEAVDDLLRLASEQSKAGRWHSSPVSLRFVAPSQHHLAPQFGRLTCMLEIPFLDGTPSGWELLSYYERRLARHGLRPHWGQAYTLMSAETVARLYPEFPRWLEAFGRFNPDQTFDNPFTERLSLRLHQELAHAHARLAAKEGTPT